LFYEGNCEVDIDTHLVKKVFAGEVVRIERNIRGNGLAKQIESGTTNSAPDNSNPGKKILDTNGTGAGGEGGELDIY
jgi:hypothetical protein